MSGPESETIKRDRFQEIYAGNPPWDIGKPQPVIAAAADELTGSLLDAGCGTGENALFFASRGLVVTGIDFLEQPLAVARRKAEARGIAARFLVKDALTLGEWEERFDSILDCGLFHVFSDKDRTRYVSGLVKVLKPGGRLLLACFSELTPTAPGIPGPRRVSEKELRDSFRDAWEIERMERGEFEIRPEMRAQWENPKAWLMLARRAAEAR